MGGDDTTACLALLEAAGVIDRCNALAQSYFRHVHVCRGAFFPVKLDYISDDTTPPIPGSQRRRAQENLRVHVAQLSPVCRLPYHD